MAIVSNAPIQNSLIYILYILEEAAKLNVTEEILILLGRANLLYSVWMLS